MKVWSAIFKVPLRGLLLVLALADHVRVPLPIPLGGLQVSHVGAVLDGVHAQPLPAVTVSVPPADPASIAVPLGETAKLHDAHGGVVVETGDVLADLFPALSTAITA